MFATLPDVVGNPEATLKRGQKYLDLVKGMNYPIAYVGQDGAVDAPWDDFDTLFIGGSTDWKISRRGAGRLVDKALARGKKVHMGRVNSKARLMLAESWGCHSADGNFLAFGPNVNLPKMLRWRQQMNLIWGAIGGPDPS
jgi:hypothetical protein